MPLLKSALRAARPLALAVGLSAVNAERERAVSVMDAGDPALAARLAEVLGVPVRAPVATDLIVCALAPGGDLEPIAHRLAEHRRHGGDVLVVVLGSAAQRRRGMRLVGGLPDLGTACTVHAERLDAVGADALRDAVVVRLGLLAVPVARSTPGLRRSTAKGLTRRAARRAAVVAAIPSQAARRPLLTVIQVRLAADVSALGGGRPSPKSAVPVAGAVLGAPVWRQLARSLTRAVPGASAGIRGGVAYAATRGVGALAEKTGSPGSASPEEDS